jgi:hypothetical protein
VGKVLALGGSFGMAITLLALLLALAFLPMYPGRDMTRGQAA